MNIPQYVIILFYFYFLKSETLRDKVEDITDMCNNFSLMVFNEMIEFETQYLCGFELKPCTLE